MLVIMALWELLYVELWYKRIQLSAPEEARLFMPRVKKSLWWQFFYYGWFSSLLCQLSSQAHPRERWQKHHAEEKNHHSKSYAKGLITKIINVQLIILLLYHKKACKITMKAHLCNNNPLLIQAIILIFLYLHSKLLILWEITSYSNHG